ncbi:uncharacterized protein LOC142351441 [Convolutriloba macropyga]|uniref:uncharacterized protein LOC142351441 n=1 Tax=Convolutriloba macropyga TaxID=536237 RepID=UPI003F5218AD
MVMVLTSQWHSQTVANAIIVCLLFAAFCQNQKLYDICDPELPVISESGVLLTPNRITGEAKYDPNLDCSTRFVNENEGGGSIKMLFNLFDVERLQRKIYIFHLCPLPP